MSDLKKSQSNIVFFDVKDDKNLSFYFDTAKKQHVEAIADPICRVELSSSAYRRLIEGSSTFELEVFNSEMKIYGDSTNLRKFGSFLRTES